MVRPYIQGGIPITNTGIITKGIGGFYYVAVDNGDIFQCRARGIFRHEGNKLTPCVGDKVDIEILDSANNIGVLDHIHPRENMLIRPPVANVSQIAIVISTANPAPNFLLVDKLIANAERENIDVLICVNKTDIKTDAQVAEIYQKSGFRVIPVCAALEQNLDNLAEALSGKVTVLAGNSGVGKSSILNLLMGENVMEVGDVSEKIARGKHTTRHSELLQLPAKQARMGIAGSADPLDGPHCDQREPYKMSFIIDTPGFSAFETTEIRSEDVETLFREFEPYLGECKFTGCAHKNDKGCAVTAALESGEIPKSRYDSYVSIFDAAKKINDWER